MNEQPCRNESHWLHAWLRAARHLAVSAVVAGRVADRQIFQVAAATLGQGFDVLQRGIGMGDMFLANPARYKAVELARHGFVDLVARQ